MWPARDAPATLFLSCSFQFFKDWKELLYLDIQIMAAVRTVHLRLDDVTWCVADKFADSDTDGTGYLLQATERRIAIDSLTDGLLTDVQLLSYLLGGETALADFLLNIWHTIYIFKKQRCKDRHLSPIRQMFSALLLFIYCICELL